ncbi:MAG: hypothetical protein DWQ07_12365 [Chloroflexi bacterium]|nr:MAG: hypothetical protein DWQ07_12365 [Chloroflexota bacterium]MBL1196833.1 hypothetical protein [Chloroflexota bacterium]NOH14128.1 hypothetical protein [Chloroflexota bacterium]
MSNTFKLFLLFAFGMVGVIVIAMIGFGVIRYQRFQATGDDLPAQTTLTQVAISNLSNGDEAQIGHPLFIEGYAAGPTAFLSLELWIDGQLATVQSAYAAGSSPFETSFRWLPDTPGAHSLVLRAVDELQQTTNSTPVIVVVPEQAVGETNDVAGFSGSGEEDVPVVFPAGGGGSSYSIPAPSADDSLGDAADWSPSVGGWVDNITNSDQPPTAPELAATAGQCSSNLSIHDLSDNELGFKVLRYLPSFDQWVEVATLGAQSQNDWLIYTDAGISGALQYQVVAFNQAGNSASNVVPVNVDPANCPDIQAELGVVDLTLQSLGTQFPRDMAYCYRSFDGGVDWERWPASGFFYPNEDGELDVVVQSSWLFNTLGERAVETFDLKLDCWGWSGNQLSSLGQYEITDVDPLQAGLYPLGSGDSSITLGVWPGNQLEQTVFYPLNNHEGQLQYAENQPDGFTSVLSAIPPEEREMPGIILSATDNADICEDHLSPESRNLVGRILFCFPYQGFDSEETGGEQGVNTQQYLVWDFDLNGCRAAIYDPGACKSYEYYLEQAELTEGQVGFWINDSASQNQHAQNAPGFTQFVIPPLSCASQQRTFSVQMWYQPGPKSLDPEFIQVGEAGPGNVFGPIDEDNQILTAGLGPEDYIISKLYFVGPLSNEVTIPCPEPLGDNVKIEITFNTMELSNIDDGEDVDELEIYGYFLAEPHSTLSDDPTYLNIATWQSQHEDCPDDTGPIGEFEQDLAGNAADGCPHEVFGGTYGIWELYACDSAFHDKCASKIGHSLQNPSPGFVIGNDNLVINIGDGDSIDLHVEFWDYDEASADDLLCVGHVNFEARNIFQWAVVDETSAFVAPTQSSGNCSISFTVQAVP